MVTTDRMPAHHYAIIADASAKEEKKGMETGCWKKRGWKRGVGKKGHGL